MNEVTRHPALRIDPWARPGSISVLLALAALLFAGPMMTLFAADAPARQFDAARKAFDDGFYERAENSFSNFVAQFPESPQLPNAMLLAAQAALAQKRFEPAAEMLSTNMPRAGALADQFQYWLGQTFLQSGRFDAAGEAFAVLVKTHTNSALRLDASFGEAEARFRLRQWPRVEALLSDPAGVFRTLSRARATNDTLAVRGDLLLAEALLEQRKLEVAEQLLARVPDAAIPPKLRWLRQYLLCRVQFAAQRMEPALAGTTNLLAIAAATADASLRSTSSALQGEILEALNRPAAAMLAYEANLAPDAPPERRREAFLKGVELMLNQNRLPEAIARLEKFRAEQPGQAGSDVALLALAELRLKQHQLAGRAAPAAAGTTNLLDAAQADLARLLSGFPQSPHLAKAQLTRGWIFLAQGRPAESLAAFQAAADGLPPSEAQATARFKVADLQFSTGDLNGAATNYWRVVTEYEGLPRVNEELAGRALYQMVQASVVRTNMDWAEAAVKKLLALAPQSSYAERSLLLFGQAVPDQEQARKVFAEFADRFPDSALLPEVKLAVARSYEEQQDWPTAIAEYERWTARFPTNESLARAEFFRALAYDRAGHRTNALTLFTGFVQRFATNALAVRAQNWIGDYYFTLGKLKGNDGDADFREAERNYQLLFAGPLSTNWPRSALTFEAQLKAGRAAYQRQGWDDALKYFTTLVNITDPRCPDGVKVEAAFAYGDTVIQRPQATNSVERRFGSALTIFELIARDWPNDPNVPRAWGRIADCHLQLAAVAPDSYEEAYKWYGKVTNAANADITARSQAEVGMGHVRRRQADAASARTEAGALRDAALAHYLNVFYGTNVRANETAPDPMWVKIAGQEAANVAELQKKWGTAVKVYRRLLQMMPVIRPSIEKRLNYAREQEAMQNP